jgi:hypothetical protein
MDIPCRRWPGATPQHRQQVQNRFPDMPPAWSQSHGDGAAAGLHRGGWFGVQSPFVAPDRLAVRAAGWVGSILV